MARQSSDSFEKLVSGYIHKLREIAAHHDISDELSFRPASDFLLNGLADALGKKEMAVITEPFTRKAVGRPDYKLKTGKDFIIGYLETKGISSNITEYIDSEQVERYCASWQRLVLTNYLEFVLFDYASSEKDSPVIRVDQVKLLGKKDLLSGKLPHPADIDALRKLLDRFLREARPEIGGAQGLAKRMANIAHIIRDSIGNAFENNSASSTLKDLHKAFQEILIPDLKTHLKANDKGKGMVTSFDDMYAQTIVYGLFAARCNHDNSRGPFTRRLASYDLPKTNPFLKKLFEHMAGSEIEDEPFCWAVDDLAQLLACVDMSLILKDFGRRTKQEDPVVHFYETFLSAYDPKMREARGVYYTPEPVVSYIVRSVDHILKTDFKLKDGLADTTTIKAPNPYSKNKKDKIDIHKVLILDPAVGTGTFLHGVIDHIQESFKGNKGMWSGYVSNHLLPRIFGFEVLMAPYAVAHMKLGLQLAETGYDFATDERLKVFLTNTLEEVYKFSNLPLLASWLAEEANAAGNIKQDSPVMVVMGNPPYSYESENTGEWITGLIRDYYQIDGQPLGERNPKGLQDDYVKFIRFAQWRIEKTGYGILAFITNHGYLDNPTFRGMRKSLMQTFDDIYILNLHGNTKKKEKSPDGSKDENVFDIQQGVAIGIFIKRQGNKSVRPELVEGANGSQDRLVEGDSVHGSTGSPRTEGAKVRHADLWGQRKGKYAWLSENELSGTEWTTVKPQEPHYLFVPQDAEWLEEYEQGWKVTGIFPINSVGISTAQDSLTVKWTEEEAWDTVTDFALLPSENAREKYQLGENSTEWSVELAQKDLKDSGLVKKNIKPILYRPFDVRYTYYTGNASGFHSRARGEVMCHMLSGDNLGVLLSRQVVDEFKHALVTKYIANRNGLATAGRFGSGPFFPLYLYPQTEIEKRTGTSRRPNLAPAFIKEFAERLGMEFIPDGKGDKTKTFGPEDIFDYMYAVFHSPSYRSRYAEFLKIDFPRLPLTSNPALFRSLCAIGSELVALHLMESVETPRRGVSTAYPVPGDNTVEDVRYEEPSPQPSPKGRGSETEGRVWINKEQYFEGVPPEVWNFYVGGYQVCQKWLKDRKDRKLTYDDLTHYQRIVAALAETIKQMAEIDRVIEAHGGWPIQ